ncbi:hypothetical protein [Candidatus Mycoplasma haematohominis]|uniref:Uncharacterized protein n=1 Tax=Candidatus Mycoplasma haematohominis TaxID=1494318 RepID=A0A478FP67_9MOLU|nr:hypothetical protein [Candidatus Mycoplasma haemohominis]GCE63083.1 hypothetical protein MHSWG343_00610 [Candidatus Mycoplasma haemohominis]
MTPQAAVGAGLGGLAAAGVGGTGIAYAAGAFEKPKDPERVNSGNTQIGQEESGDVSGGSQARTEEGDRSSGINDVSVPNQVAQEKSEISGATGVEGSKLTGNIDGTAQSTGESPQTGSTSSQPSATA